MDIGAATCWSGVPVVQGDTVDETSDRKGPSADQHPFAPGLRHPTSIVQRIDNGDEPVENDIDERDPRTDGRQVGDP